jgi:hypothetical protein
MMAQRRTNDTMKKTKRPWAFIAIAVFVLCVAAVVFSAAGPDRSRIPELKGTSPYAVNPSGASTEKSEKAFVPNAVMPTAPRSR